MKEIEHQNIEWKESWRDEYLKWICGFANADGGTLVIGKRDDGTIAGIANAKKLMEDIPNKVKDIMGIMVDVNLKKSKEGEYIEIIVEPYHNPVSYKGEYHYRSGSTKQELKGAALDRFLLRKYGRNWDSVPVPYVKVEDLSAEAFAHFRKLAKKGHRIDEELLSEPNKYLLEKLHLYEGSYLKRAAVLLFHPDPEKFITGSYVKIGFFRNNTDILYHDEIHGDLFTQSKKTLEILTTKYLRALISYEGIQRVETLQVPNDALREAILNALVHRDYATGAPIQIRVYTDKLMIFNSCVLPDNWTIKNLVGKHSSHPYNPDIANAFFRAGEIESWGRGIERIFTACKNEKAPKPKLELEGTHGLWIEFPFIQLSEEEMSGKMSGKTSGKTSGNKLGNSKDELREKYGRSTEEIRKKYGIIAEKIILNMIENSHITIKEIAVLLSVSQSAVEKNIAKLKKDALLQHIGSTKGGHWEVLEEK